MYFQHSAQIWRDFPALVPGVLYAEGITAHPAAAGGQTGPAAAGGQTGPAAAGGQTGPAAAGGQTDTAIDRYTAIAKTRLATVAAESELPEIQAWRRAFAALGLKPTQYRCASESLLRRFRKEGSLPRLHPLVDLCNAVSMAYAIPVAVLDLNAISGPLEVRYAAGDEEYLTFAGDTERPAPGEVIFADQAGQAHARRWTNRQSGRSAVRDATSTALIVAEALHDSAPADVPDLIAALAAELQALWTIKPQTAILSAAAPRFTPHAATPHAAAPHAATPHAATSGQRPDPQ
jgi:DNA/RNA-binding domain of Phe-tRNA-synthetase-like protein